MRIGLCVSESLRFCPCFVGRWSAQKHSLKKGKTLFFTHVQVQTFLACDRRLFVLPDTNVRRCIIGGVAAAPNVGDFRGHTFVVVQASQAAFIAELRCSGGVFDFCTVLVSTEEFGVRNRRNNASNRWAGDYRHTSGQLQDFEVPSHFLGKPSFLNGLRSEKRNFRPPRNERAG